MPASLLPGFATKIQVVYFSAATMTHLATRNAADFLQRLESLHLGLGGLAG